jgi:hypothetical protein
VNRAIVLTPIMGALLLGVVACTNDTAGQALPSAPITTTGDPGTPPESTSEETTAPSSSGGGSLGSVDPCELVTSSAASRSGLGGAGTSKKFSGADACEWRVDKGSVADSYTVDVVVYDKVGLKDIVSSGQVQELTVGSRKAVQSLRIGGGACGVSLEVTQKSRVDVIAVGGNGEALCAPALELAKLVEPELP